MVMVRTIAGNRPHTIRASRTTHYSRDSMTFLQALKEKYLAHATHREHVANFKSALIEAVSDGRLTDQELALLADLRQEYHLSLEELHKIRVKAYEVAFRAAASDKVITRAEEAELTKVRQFLQLADSDIARTQREFTRYRLIAEIQAGNLPEVSVPTVILQKAEIPHWVEPASLIEERVVGRRYVGGSSGMSVRIARGVTYRVGSCRGSLIVDKADVAVSRGDLVLTSKRVIFRGDKRSFAYRLDKLLDIHLFQEGVLITDTNGKPRTIHFASTGNADIVGGVLTAAINRFMAVT
jgi:hypothetical protein